MVQTVTKLRMQRDVQRAFAKAHPDICQVLHEVMGDVIRPIACAFGAPA